MVPGEERRRCFLPRAAGFLSFLSEVCERSFTLGGDDCAVDVSLSLAGELCPLAATGRVQVLSWVLLL